MRIPDLPRRERTAHKGDFGRVLIIAGSRGMVGAACLATIAALRSGAGLVTLASSDSAQILAAPRIISALTVPLAETQDGSIAFSAREKLNTVLGKADITAIGPGLSTNPDTAALVKRLLAEDLQTPTVLDADGINAIAQEHELIKTAIAKNKMIFTPHPGELARILDVNTAEIQADRLQAAKRFIELFPEAILVLKGANTIVISQEKQYVNATGNAGLATGGAGDVLTGLIAGLWAQKLDAFDAAVLAVYLHGLAGDLAARELTMNCLTAEDLLDYLPRAFNMHLASR